MGRTHPDRVTFSSWPQRIMSSVAVLIGGLLVGGATADTPLEPVGLFARIASLGLAVRAARMGASIDETCCVVRNLARTHRVDLSEIDGFGFATNAVTRSKNESTVLRKTSGRSITITGLTLPAPAFLQGPGRERCHALNAELQRRRTDPRDATVPG